MFTETALDIYAFGGDALTTPQDTKEAFWSALGAGAGGLALTVRLTEDGVPVCLTDADLAVTTGQALSISSTSTQTLSQLDAGACFRSTVLDENNEDTGKRGEDIPWLGKEAGYRNVVHPTLDETLKLFGRRCKILLILPDEMSDDDMEKVMKVVKQLGLDNRVAVAGNKGQLMTLGAQYPHLATLLITDAPDETAAQETLAKGYVLPFNSAFEDGTTQFKASIEDAASKGLAVLLQCSGRSVAPSPEYRQALNHHSPISGLVTPAALATVETLTPPALIVEDNFAGKNIDRTIWTAGYSHTNQDTNIYQDDGIHIDIKQGGEYSGAAAVCLLPIHGRFDARCSFHVESPHQGTTFEMAAIGIDPGYYRINNEGLNTRNVNLTFDVHGAPPYASSERDEDDGFRCGWNNGFCLTKIDPDWSASSANMYNKYGRDVGDGDPALKEGELRLVRNGAVFATYYRDAKNHAWVNSGAMLVQNLGDDVYIRLAAKHWKKSNPEPPGNHVIFWNFHLYQL